MNPRGIDWHVCVGDALFKVAGVLVWCGSVAYRLARRVRYGSDADALKAELMDG
jgi:hypothetical protein